MTSTEDKTETYSKTKDHSEVTFWVETWPEMDFNRMFITPVIVLVAVLFGAIAAAYGALNSAVEITMVMAPAMAVLVLTLGTVPMRWIFYAFGFSLIMDILVMLI